MIDSTSRACVRPLSIPPHAGAHLALAVSQHVRQVPLALGAEPRVPQVGRVGNDPAEPLLQNPGKVAPVVASIGREALGERVQQLRGPILLELPGRVVVADVVW